MRRAVLTLLLLGSLATTPPRAQEPASDLPAFEVASIKPRTGERAFGGPSAPDRFVNADTTLRGLIRFAYDVQDFQIDGGPDWVDEARFDVSATAAGQPTRDEMRQMVRRLLAERFGLRTHVETREMPIYALVMARADRALGAQMRPATFDCGALLDKGAGALPPRGPGEPAPRCAWRIGLNAAVSRMFLDGASVPRFAALIQPMLRRIIIDRTGLTGTFDIELEFATDQIELPLPLPPDAPAGTPRDGLSLFTAVEEQLGLKLESERGPVDVIVIDAARMPDPD